MDSTLAREPQAPLRFAGPKGLPRLLAGVRPDGRPDPLASHIRRYGLVREAAHGEDLVALLEASGLTGRGGAGFPTSEKFRSVVAQRGRPVVLINAAEGEPASCKDRALLGALPQLVLDGAVLAAKALGAKDILVGVAADAVSEQSVFTDAVADRQQHGSDGRVAIRVASVPTGFVSGEETALIRYLNGGPPKPSFVPPRPFERGVGGAPTLVLNVETSAQVALIARFGGDWFRELGTAREPGSTLVTLTGAVQQPGVREIALGTTFADLVQEAGGLTGPVSAFLVGGYFGTWLRTETVMGLRLLDSDLMQHGASLGARAIVALPAEACAMHELTKIARYLADESAGQCGPCVHGLAAIAEGLERVSAGRGDDRKRLARWVDEVRGRGACKHPDGATRFVSSALDVFGDEVRLHLRHGRCRRGRTVSALPLPKTAKGR